MLELLPLERLHPEERIIFDPAAGSGSLLLAATSRLAGVSDIPENLE
jgi:type I restriction-modification system DNA methylase subunit